MKKWILTVMPVMVLLYASWGCTGGDRTTETPAPATDAAGQGGGTSAGAATAAPVVARAPAAPEYQELTIPAGTPLELTLTSAVASDSSRVEDAVRATLRTAVIVNGQNVLPAGTEVAGSITATEESGRVKGRARVAFRFTSLSHNGSRYDLQTAAISELAPATKGDDAKKIGIGAGAGAALGAIFGGGKGAAEGAAIGAGSGTGLVLATKGKEVRLESGAHVTTSLTAPLKVRVRVRR